MVDIKLNGVPINRNQITVYDNQTLGYDTANADTNVDFDFAYFSKALISFEEMGAINGITVTIYGYNGNEWKELAVYILPANAIDVFETSSAYHKLRLSYKSTVTDQHGKITYAVTLKE